MELSHIVISLVNLGRRVNSLFKVARHGIVVTISHS